MRHVCELCGRPFRCRYRKRACKKQDSLGRSLHACAACVRGERTLHHTSMLAYFADNETGEVVR